jgi:competence protein ComEA
MKKYLIVILLFLLGLFLIMPENKVVADDLDTIKIDIKGYVNNPGVYTIKSNSRVIDAITMAGGLDEQASTKYINLSRKLSDGDVIIIYSQAEVDNTNNQTMITFIDNKCTCPTIKNDACLTDNINNKNALININTASLEELMTIKGFGKTKAQSIIDYRTKNGNFINIEDIKNVKGIGDSTYDKIKAYITV